LLDSKNQVLVVDDDQGICQLVSRMLEHLGHQSVTVCSGECAVDECKNGQYDLVLLDVEMPNMDGRQVYDALRNAMAELPVIFMRLTKRRRRRGLSGQAISAQRIAQHPQLTAAGCGLNQSI